MAGAFPTNGRWISGTRPTRQGEFRGLRSGLRRRPSYPNSTACKCPRIRSRNANFKMSGRLMVRFSDPDGFGGDSASRVPMFRSALDASKGRRWLGWSFDMYGVIVFFFGHVLSRHQNNWSWDNELSLFSRISAPLDVFIRWDYNHLLFLPLIFRPAPT